MASPSWQKFVNGNWTTAADWSTGTTPAPGDDVTLPALGAYVVTSAKNVTIDSITVGADVELSITGGTFTTTDTGTKDSNSGLIQVSGGALDIDGTISDVEAELSASASGAIIDLIGGSITCVNNSGGGSFGDTIVNIAKGATVEATGGASAPSTITGGGGTIVNNGTLVANNGTTLTLFGLFVNGTGVIKANNGIVELNGSTIWDNTLTSVNGGTIESEYVNTFIGVTISSGTVVDVENNTFGLQLAGTSTDNTITNNGTIELTGSTYLWIVPYGTGPSVTLAGAGYITLSGGGDVVLNSASSLETLINAGNTIQGVGSIGNILPYGNEFLALNNEAGGTINANVAYTPSTPNPLIIDTGNQVINAGLMEATAGGMLQVYDDISNTGTIKATGTNSTVNLVGGSIDGGTVKIGAGATLEATGGPSSPSTIDDGAVVTDAGTLLVNNHTHLTLTDVTVNAAGGTIEASDSLSGPSTIVLGNGTTINGGTLTTSDGGIIETKAGSTTAILDAVTISGESTVTVLDGGFFGGGGSTLNLEGTITNDGSIAVSSLGDTTSLEILANVKLNGDGVVTLSQGFLTDAAQIVGPGSGDVTLTNASNTIQGVGSIGDGDQSLTLTNQAGGVIDANGNGSLTIDTGNTVTNAGLMEAWQPLLVAAVDPPQLIIDDPVTNSGIIAAQDGCSVVLANSIKDTATGTIQLNSTGDPTTLYISGVVELTGAGGVVLSDNTNNQIIDLPNASPSAFSTLENDGNTISGVGSIGIGDNTPGLELQNIAGTIDANIAYNPSSPNPLTIDTGQTVDNSALIEATNGGLLVIDDPVNNAPDATGTIKATGTGSTVDLNGGSITGGTVTIGSGATLEATGGSSLPSTIGDPSGSPTTTVTDGGTLLVNGGTQLTLLNATTTATGGLVEASGAGSTLYIEDLSITTGVTGGTLEATNDGTVSLGDAGSNGGVVINSTLETSSGGVIETAAQTDSELKGVTISTGTTVTVVDNSDLTLLGTITNDGTINLASSSDPTQLTLGGNTTLSGGGQVTLSDNAANEILGPGSPAGPYTLTNTNNTIEGSGSIGDYNAAATTPDASLVLKNQAGGTIDATGANPLTIDTGNQVTNAGTLEATNPDALPSTGGLVVDDAVANSGTITANGGNVTINGALTLTGSIDIFSGNTVTLGSSVGASQTVTFENNSASNSYLVLGTAQSFAGKVAGFAPAAGDYIDLLDFNSATTTITGVKTTSGVTGVTLTDSSTHISETVHLVGTYTLGQLAVESAAAAGLSGTSAVLYHT